VLSRVFNLEYPPLSVGHCTKCKCNNRSKITIIDLNIIIIVILFETATYVLYCIIIDAKAEAAYCNRQLYNQYIHYYRHGNNIPDMWYIIIRLLYYMLVRYCYRFSLLRQSNFNVYRWLQYRFTLFFCRFFSSNGSRLQCTYLFSISLIIIYYYNLTQMWRRLKNENRYYMHVSRTELHSILKLCHNILFSF